MKIDFHVHTKHSPDSLAEPIRLVSVAKRRKLGAIAITDHNSFDGVTAAKIAAAKIAPNLIIIGGQEVMTNKGELLCLFLKRKIKANKFEEVCHETHEQGGIVAVPHPFDSYRYHVDLELLSKRELNMLDAIEAFNSRASHWSDNHRALKFADKHNLPVIAGSDSHFAFELGTSRTHISAKNLDEIKNQVLLSKSRVFGKESAIRKRILPIMTKIVTKIKRMRK